MRASPDEVDWESKRECETNGNNETDENVLAAWQRFVCFVISVRFVVSLLLAQMANTSFRHRSRDHNPYKPQPIDLTTAVHQRHRPQIFR